MVTLTTSSDERDGELPQTTPMLASEHLDRLHDVEGVADRIAQRLFHVGDRDPCRSPHPRARPRQASANAVRLGRLHERPAPAFTSSRIRSVSTASFFDMTLAAISGIEGTVAVASRRA